MAVSTALTSSAERLPSSESSAGSTWTPGIIPTRRRSMSASTSASRSILRYSSIPAASTISSSL